MFNTILSKFKQLLARSTFMLSFLFGVLVLSGFTPQSKIELKTLVTTEWVALQSGRKVTSDNQHIFVNSFFPKINNQQFSAKILGFALSYFNNKIFTVIKQCDLDHIHISFSLIIRPHQKKLSGNQAEYFVNQTA